MVLNDEPPTEGKSWLLPAVVCEEIARIMGEHPAWSARPAVEIERGRVLWRFNAKDNADDTKMGAAGGVSDTIMAGLLNMACVMALYTVAKPRERLIGTIELNISFTRPAIGSLTADARVIQKGRKIGFVCCDIRDGQGKIVATGRVVHSIGLRRDAAASDAEFLWPELELLRLYYMETMRGNHPAWKMSPVSSRCRRGHLEWDHEIPAGRANQAGGSMLAGEYLIKCDVTDAAGNSAKQLNFALLMSGMVGIACVGAVATVTRKGEVRAGTVELNLSFVRPAVGIGRKIRIVGDVFRKGKSVANAICTISDDKGRQVVCGRIAYAIRPDPKANRREAAGIARSCL
jgi:uncharacterized protein (TIGR00369 family)